MSGVRIKICGVTNVADALAAVRLGADALGFNLYAGSPRHVGVADAAGIVRELPPFTSAVAVLVNEPLAAILGTMPQLGAISTIQWHGDDPPVFSQTPYRFAPAFSIGDVNDLAKVNRYLERCRAADSLPAAVLLDGHRAGLHGGTGQPAPWELLALFDPGVPIILAGGLTPDNVAEAIRIVRPYAVDVASGVESAPGRKDVEKMRRFIDNARSAAAGIAGAPRAAGHG